MRTRTQLPSWTILLVGFPILAFLAAETLIARYAKLPIYTTPSQYGPTMWAEASGRMQLLALLLLYYLFATGVVVKFGTDLLRLFKGASLLKLLAAYFICFGVGFVLVRAVGNTIPPTQDLMGSKLFEDALAQASPSGSDKHWGPAVFEWIIFWNNAFTVAAVPAFIAGGISCLARFRNTTAQENWVVQSDRLKTYIYMSAGLLVIGVLYLKAWTQYPGYLLDQKAAPAYTSLVNAYAMFTGVEYSLVLSAFALPVAFVLSRRADRIAARIVMTEEKRAHAPDPLPYSAKLKAVRERELLVITSQDVLKTLVALLAPFVTGTVASLSSVVG